MSREPRYTRSNHSSYSRDAYSSRPAGSHASSYANQVPQGGSYPQQDPYGRGYQAPYAGRDAYDVQAVNGYARGSVPVSGASHSRYASQPSPKSGVSVVAVVVAVVIALLVGAGASFVYFSLQPKVLKPVPAVLTDSQLSSVVGLYVFDGVTYEITAKEAILGSASLESVQTGQGYRAPTADMVLSYARNQILAHLVYENGITVGSEEVAAYANQAFGTSDFNQIGAYLGMSASQAQVAVSEATAVSKLRKAVTGSFVGAPLPPEVPVDGNTEVGSAYYANYIIGLLGANWDAASGTWANTSNEYYQVLSNMVFAPGSASYDAAQAAYSIAYEQWSATASGDAWTSYLDTHLGNGAISIATLLA